MFDATGLGVGLMHVFEEKGYKVAARIVSSGGAKIGQLQAARLSVPKPDLIAALDGAVQNGELQGSPNLPCWKLCSARLVPSTALSRRPDAAP